MKLIRAGLLFCAIPAYAATAAPVTPPIKAPAVSVARYLAARDRAIAAANREKAPLSDKAQARALAALEHQLAGLVPPFAAAGFKPKPKINLATLTHDLGFGMLDGLVTTSTDDKTAVLVTTKPLLEAWIKAHASDDTNDVNVPQTIEAALHAEALYTAAISPDAMVATYAEIPVATPADASLATAMLDLRRQDIGRDMPNEIIVAVVRGDTVFIASQPVREPLQPIPACEAIWDKAQTKSEAALADYQAHHLGDDAVFQAAQTIASDGDVAHRQCIAEKLKGSEAGTRLETQAQALVAVLK